MELEKYKEINFENNKKLIWGMGISSLILFFVGFLVFPYVGFFLTNVPQEGSVTFGILDVLIFFVTYSGTLLLHEGIHGLFFKIFAPDRPVVYRNHGYALSASSPQTTYTKGKFMWIGIAPFIFMTLGICLALYLQIIHLLFFVLLLSFHTAGCVGDFYFLYLLSKEPADILVEDTGAGMIFYRKR